MLGVIAASGSAWTYGGAILSFVFLMILFIAVVGGLYVLYTKPHLTPGHYYRMGNRPAAPAGTPAAPGQTGEAAQAGASPEDAGDR